MTKKQRSNTKYSWIHILKKGSICSLLVNGVKCGAITFDLSTHLTRYHEISKNDDSYISVMKSARFIHKQNSYCVDNSELIVSSSVHTSKPPYFSVTERNATEAYSHHNLSPIVSSSRNLSDEFSYHSDSETNSDRLDVMQHFSYLFEASISEHMFQEIVNARAQISGNLLY